MHRFLVPGFPEGGSLTLTGEEAHHLVRVLRARAGDRVALFDGAGRECEARIEAIQGSAVELQFVGWREPVPEPRVPVTLAQALLKSDKMDRVVRDAVMLGVSAIQPFASRRGDVPIDALRDGGRIRRWEKTVIASAKQSGRAVVPRVLPGRTLSEVLRDAPFAVRLMCVEPQAGGRVQDLATAAGSAPASALVLIGPEGGWDDLEIAEAQASGATLVSFGRRVLRADAAGAAVLAALRLAWRDL